MATSAHLYTMPVPCQHNIFRGNTLQIESLHIKHITAEFSLPPCRLTTLQVCQACKNSLSTGQQYDCCQLICTSYAQTRPANVPVSGALPGLSISDDILDKPETVYFQLLPGGCSSNHTGEASTFLTAFSEGFLARSRYPGVQAFRSET